MSDSQRRPNRASRLSYFHFLGSFAETRGRISPESPVFGKFRHQQSGSLSCFVLVQRHMQFDVVTPPTNAEAEWTMSRSHLQVDRWTDRKERDFSLLSRRRRVPIR